MSVLVDTSFLFALANRNDRSHAACYAVAQTTRERLVVPQTVLPEAAYLIDSRLGHPAMREFARQMSQPGWTIEALEQADLLRTTEILEQYGTMRLDFVDATLMALAERLRIRIILTLDWRHFAAVRPRHCAMLELLPSQ